MANPGTITGSIGVIGLAFNAEQLFKKIRLNYSTVNFGKRADMGSTNRPWRQDEKDLMIRMIDHSYTDFTTKVASGRNMKVEDIHKIAQGRVWTGAQALENGLIDELGGLDEAVRQMRKLTSIKGKIRLVDATSDTKGIAIEMKSDPLSLSTHINVLKSIADEYVQVYELWQDYHNDSVLMLAPYIFENQIK
ncbi:MAG: S49 family peptidase [Candidatus Cloacimonadaceae bacterium]|nr:S49 family peptidase [Candidatus Cloacimonadaceae bacterium]